MEQLDKVTTLNQDRGAASGVPKRPKLAPVTPKPQGKQGEPHQSPSTQTMDPRESNEPSSPRTMNEIPSVFATSQVPSSMAIKTISPLAAATKSGMHGVAPAGSHLVAQQVSLPPMRALTLVSKPKEAL